MVRHRAAEAVPTHVCRDDFGLAHRISVQALRVSVDESFEDGGGRRQRPGLNSWLSARIARIRGVKTR